MQSTKKIKKTSKWTPHKKANCTDSPLASSVEQGVSFQQTKTCNQAYAQTVFYTDGTTSKNYKSESSKTKTTVVGTKTVLNSATTATVIGATALAATTTTANKSITTKKIVKSQTAWTNIGTASCGSWSPSKSTQPKNKPFKETQTCSQKQTQTTIWSDGGKSSDSKTHKYTNTQKAYGTKITSSKKKTKKKK